MGELEENARLIAEQMKGQLLAKEREAQHWGQRATELEDDVVEVQNQSMARINAAEQNRQELAGAS